MMRIILLLGILLIGVMLFGCAPKVAPVAPVEEKPSEVAVPIVKESWEVGWEKLKIEARKEGKVVIYGSVRPVFRDAFIKAFKEKFGIDMEVVALGPGETVTRLVNERKVGLYLADILLGGATTPITQIKPLGMEILDYPEPQLILPEVLDPSAWFEGRLRWIDKDKTTLAFMYYPSIFLGINTTFVKKGDIKSFQDLLNPRWKSKIAMYDPTVPGMGNAIFSVMLEEGVLRLDYWRELLKQEPLITRDHRQMTEWLAHEKVHITVSAEPEIFADLRRAGATIDRIVPGEGTYAHSGTGNINLLKNPANPKAAKLFINWLLTLEGQTLASKTMAIQSARLDVPTDHLDPRAVRQPGVKYFEAITEERILKTAEHRKLASEIFEPFMKK